MPAGFSGAFSDNPIEPEGEGTLALLSVDGAVEAGEYTVLIEGNAPDLPTRTLPIEIEVLDSAPQSVRSMEPSGAFVAHTPTFSWDQPDSGRPTHYFVELGRDSTLSTVEYSARSKRFSKYDRFPQMRFSELSSEPLLPNTTYYWQVRAENLCGGTESRVIQFRTGS